MNQKNGMTVSLTPAEKTTIKQKVEDRYASRNGRNVRISKQGWSVSVEIDGNGSQMHKGKDMSGGRIFAGDVKEILSEHY